MVKDWSVVPTLPSSVFTGRKLQEAIAAKNRAWELIFTSRAPSWPYPLWSCPLHWSPQAMAQALDLIPWPPDASPVYAAPAVLIPLEPKKSMLAGVKEHIYHPCLPTLRRMDMDTMVNRLTDQHCRTSTTCSKEDFQRATFTVGGVPSSPLVRRSLAGRSRAGKLAPLPPSTNQEEWPSYTRAMQDWSRFVSAAGELPLLNLQGKGRRAGSCYAVRYLKPDVTQTWRYCLNQNPSLDRYGPKPLPYNTV
uniref:Sperm microtubule inner protein 8 n=1 Tax=Naja naja TaxID=35670 RepID=A0A8C6VMX1_NAJNA